MGTLPDYPAATTPFGGTELIALWQNNEQAQTPIATLGAYAATQFQTSIDLFANLSSRTTPAPATSIVTGGYSTAGVGGATYVADSLATSALAASYPNCCKADQSGRYWRLAGPLIYVEQVGATGVGGHNDQPAILQAYAYAAAVGIEQVGYQNNIYDLWVPTRTTATTTLAPDGQCIVFTEAIESIAAGGGTTFVLFNNEGGPYSTVTQTVGGNPWYGGGIFVWPGGNGEATISRIKFTGGFVLQGGIGYTLSGSAPAGNTGPGQTGVNLTSKGFWCQDVNVTEIDLGDFEAWGFAGEVMYFGGTEPRRIFGNRVVFHDSPQSAWNPGSNAAVEVASLRAYNAYQAAEILGGYGHTYGSAFFGQSAGASISAGAFGTGGLPYNYPERPAAGDAPPWVNLGAARFEQVAQVLVGAYVRGRAALVDSYIFSSYVYSPNACDIDLELDCWVDQQNASTAFFYLQGPPTTTTQISGAPTGTYYQKPQAIRVAMHMHRTDIAIAEGYQATAVWVAELLDPTSVKFSIDGDIGQTWAIEGTPPTGFAVPLIECSSITGTNSGLPLGGGYLYPTVGSVNTIEPQNSALTIYPETNGTTTINIGSTYGYADGQLLFIYGGIPGAAMLRPIVFPQGGTGLNLAKQYTIYETGDFLILRYDATLSKWSKFAYSSGIAQMGATEQTAAASPTAPASTSAYTMQGLAGSITPNRSGNILVSISGTIVEPAGTAAGLGIEYQIAYGTGTAPTNAAATTGTNVGSVQEYTNAATVTAADVHTPFHVSAMITGLALGTAYWLDLAAQAITTASDLGLSNVTIAAAEF